MSYLAASATWALQEYGIRRVVYAVSTISLLSFPFVLWLDFYLIFGEGFLDPHSPLRELTLVLLFLSFLELAYFTLIVEWSSTPEKELIKRLSRAPREKGEIESISRGYLNIFTIRGWSSRSRRKKLSVFGDQIFLAILSYPLIVFLIYLVRWLEPMLFSLFEPVYQSVRSLQITSNILTPALICMFVLSLYSLKLNQLRIWGFFREHHKRLPIEYALAVPVPYLSILAAYSSLVTLIAQAVHPRLICRPPSLPSDLSLMVDKSFQNIQGKACNVSEFSYKIRDNGEFESSKELTMRYFRRQTASLGIEDVQLSDAISAFDEIRPTLYLGTVDEQYAFVGIVGYNAVQKARVGIFYFNGSQVRKEFQAILDKNVEKSRFV